jgi:hypothetical protein
VELVQDPLVDANGYQASFINPDHGLFLFTHKLEGCHSTFSLPVSAFRDFYRGEGITTSNRDQPTCSQHCTFHNNLEACHEYCSMRWVRDVIQLLRRHEVPAHLQTTKAASRR